MANTKLEKFILKCSAALFVLYTVVILLCLDHKGQNLCAAVIGYLLGVFLFESTAMVYGSAVYESKARSALSVGVLLGAFVLLLLALFAAQRISGTVFWVLFGGIVSIPVTVMIYIVLEAAGILHTDFFT